MKHIYYIQDEEGNDHKADRRKIDYPNNFFEMRKMIMLSFKKLS